jgi:hypothetical protein
MKILRKKDIISNHNNLLKILDNNLVKYAMSEKNILSVLNHPFIVKLNYAF